MLLGPMCSAGGPVAFPLGRECLGHCRIWRWKEVVTLARYCHSEPIVIRRRWCWKDEIRSEQAFEAVLSSRVILGKLGFLFYSWSYFIAFSLRSPA